MLVKIRSFFIVIILHFQMWWDNIYRFFAGIPTLKRSQITANLFLGSQYNLLGLQKLKALGVTAIINMRVHSVYSQAQYEGFHYLHLPTPDNTPPATADLIRGAEFAGKEIKNGGIVYIHCRQGLGRGPTMTIAYLISTGLTYNDAYALVKKVRTFIHPQAEQTQRLKELEQYYQQQEV
jgi:hypothetical protein